MSPRGVVSIGDDRPPHIGSRPNAGPWLRRFLWLLRGILVLHLLAVVIQPVLAGLFLSGDVDAILVHGVVASLLTTLGLVLVVVALGYALAGGRWWPLPVTALMFTAEGLQIGLGYSRSLDIHIPLGIAITVCAVLLTVWSWSSSAARPRRHGGRPRR